MPTRGAYLNTREMFWAKVEKTDTCWLYSGPLLPAGYGYFYFEGERHYAHRFSYEELVGEIPAEHELDHLRELCDHRNCVNPAHLEPVTHRENVLRSDNFAGKKARQTHCIHGHEFTPENTYVEPGRGVRSCRACGVIRASATRARRK